MILGVDVGGTFTDVVTWDGSHLRSAKVPSTRDQSEGVLAGSRRLIDGDVDKFLHGTTVATNALLERRGARTALVTTSGFEDVLEIGRQDRPSLYDPFADRPDPLVGRGDRFGVDGDTFDAGALAGYEAVAVALMYGFEHPEQEREIRSLTASVAPDVPVSLASEVVAEFREFERTSTTVLNAYLTPVTSRYLSNLSERVRDSGLADEVVVMRSSGGLITAEEAAAVPAAALLSGPAGGVVAASALGTRHGKGTVVAFDMGGTSTDVCRIEDGRPDVSYERSVAGYPCRMPAVAIHTVGAGGGSIGWIDPGESLRVGPSSSGADPGPACYGRGGRRATVTDANVVLGRIAPHASLGSDSLTVNRDLAVAALSQLGSFVELDAEDAALGVVDVVEEIMARAVRTVSIEEGADPRSATLIAFGGAGGLHATALARRLDMAGVLVPLRSGVFSALGLLLSPPRADEARSTFIRKADSHRLSASLEEMAIRAAERLEHGGSRVEVVRTFADVRYVGQSHEITVPLAPTEDWEGLVASFHDEHEARNGFARRSDPVEVVTVRAEAEGLAALSLGDLPEWTGSGDASRGHRTVMAGDGPVEASVWWRDGLDAGAEVIGPAVVEEEEATTFVGTNERASVLDSGALELEW